MKVHELLGHVFFFLLELRFGMLDFFFLFLDTMLHRISLYLEMPYFLFLSNHFKISVT